MTKPTLIIKQSSSITTVKLKGVIGAWIVATNKDLVSKGLIAVIQAKADNCKAKGYKHTLVKYEMLLTALGA